MWEDKDKESLQVESDNVKATSLMVNQALILPDIVSFDLLYIYVESACTGSWSYSLFASLKSAISICPTQFVDESSVEEVEELCPTHA